MRHNRSNSLETMSSSYWAGRSLSLVYIAKSAGIGQYLPSKRHNIEVIHKGKQIPVVQKGPEFRTILQEPMKL